MIAVTIRQIAFVVLPGMTALDLIGPYDALRRVRTMEIDPGLAWRFVATSPAPSDDCGLPLHADQVRGSLAHFDLLVVPGGLGVDRLRGDPAVVAWLQSWGDARPVASVCSGALLLGDAGWLRGLPATTHHARREQLRPLCGEVVDLRVVDAGRVITAAGVTAGIDLGLHLVGRFWGAEARRRIARQMAAPPAPPRIRRARLEEAPALAALIAASARGLSRGDYSEAQIEAALGGTFGVDSELLRDGTYFVVEAEGELAACGGWSRRQTRFGGDALAGRDSVLLDPSREPARIRAFFVRPEFARRGLARELLARCETEARAAGFTAAELVATLPGVRLYEACGYARGPELRHALPGGLTIDFVVMRRTLVG